MSSTFLTFGHQKLYPKKIRQTFLTENIPPKLSHPSHPGPSGHLRHHDHPDQSGHPDYLGIPHICIFFTPTHFDT